MLKKFRSLDNWSKLVVLYLCPVIGKTSAYIGLAFGAVLLFSPRVLWGRWYFALTQRNDPLNGMAWALLVSLLYGFAETIYGILLGYPLLTALQILIFNICPVYLFLGMWVGIRHPGTIRKYIRFLAWLTVFYTPIYFIFFNHLKLSLKGILSGNGLESVVRLPVRSRCWACWPSSPISLNSGFPSWCWSVWRWLPGEG